MWDLSVLYILTMYKTIYVLIPSNCIELIINFKNLAKSLIFIHIKKCEGEQSYIAIYLDGLKNNWRIYTYGINSDNWK